MKPFPRIIISPRHEDAAGLIKSLTGSLPDSTETIYNKRNRVVSVKHPSGTIIIKCFKRPNIFSRIAYTFFRPGKARRAYDNSLRMMKAGYNAAEPVGCIELSTGGLLDRAYYAALPAEGRQLKQTVLDCDPAAPELLRAYGRMLAEMHSRGISHGDPNISNVFHTPDGKFTFIDTNRARFTNKPLRHSEILNELKRLSDNREALRHILQGYSPAESDRMYTEVTHAINRMERRRRLRHRLTGRS